MVIVSYVAVKSFDFTVATNPAHKTFVHGLIIRGKLKEYVFPFVTPASVLNKLLKTNYVIAAGTVFSANTHEGRSIVTIAFVATSVAIVSWKLYY